MCLLPMTLSMRQICGISCATACRHIPAATMRSSSITSQPKHPLLIYLPCPWEAATYSTPMNAMICMHIWGYPTQHSVTTHLLSNTQGHHWVGHCPWIPRTTAVSVFHAHQFLCQGPLCTSLLAPASALEPCIHLQAAGGRQACGAHHQLRVVHVQRWAVGGTQPTRADVRRSHGPGIV